MSRVNRCEYQEWKEFGARVKRCREQINMSKEKFAELINRSENYVSELEKGNNSASLHTLHQICVALKASPDWLMYGEMDNMNKEYSNKEILLEIIERCDDEELEIIKDLIVATFPNLDKIKDKRNIK